MASVVLSSNAKDLISCANIYGSRNQVSKQPRFNSLPTATGGIARAAYVRAIEAGLHVAPLLKKCDLTVQQVKNSDLRMAVETQIRFLTLVADALRDNFLGVRLAQSLDLRELGLLYYVLASSETLGDALRRVARYSTIHNEGAKIICSEDKNIRLTFQYVGVARMTDRHQIEFFVTILVRVCRQLTGRQLSPSSVKFVHRRAELPAKLKPLFGAEVEFGRGVDEVSYPQLAKTMRIVNADPFLNALLVKYFDEALSERRFRSSTWRLRVENAIAPLLPHGEVGMAEVARKLGIRKRTLARRLASEGQTFLKVLDSLRSDLSKRYLREPGLPISEVAWLVGYREASAFNHAFKRWTGSTPKQVRSAVVADPGK
jgi:AraC-like DNA-binding protein